MNQTTSNQPPTPTQLETRLQYSLDSDEVQDEPELRLLLRKLLEDTEALNKRIRVTREDYDFKINNLPF